MRRLLSGVLATCLALSLVRCSGASRETFDEDDAASDASTEEVTSSSSSGGPSITGDGGPSDGGPKVCTEDIDVVLVIDTSSSMNFVLDALKDEFESVVTASNQLKSGAHFGAVFFQDNVLLDTSGDEEGGKVHLGSASLASAFSTMKTVYTEHNRNPADGPSGPVDQNPVCEENSLDAIDVAATQFPWRDNAAHVVVVVTDDTFLERPDNYGDGNHDGDTTDTSPFREGNYPAASTLAETITALAAQRIKVFSFTRVTPLGPFSLSGCGTPRRFTDDDAVKFGWTAQYNGADPIPDQTGGKNFDLDDVKSGSLHLGDAINGIVLDVHCSNVN